MSGVHRTNVYEAHS